MGSLIIIITKSKTNLYRIFTFAEDTLLTRNEKAALLNVCTFDGNVLCIKTVHLTEQIRMCKILTTGALVRARRSWRPMAPRALAYIYI